MSFFRTAALTAIVAISALAHAQTACAQTYPTKPIHLIVPYPAGGGTDFFARLLGQKMSELIGEPIVVENKPGAATNLGADFVAKAPPEVVEEQKEKRAEAETARGKLAEALERIAAG